MVSNLCSQIDIKNAVEKAEPKSLLEKKKKEKENKKLKLIKLKAKSNCLVGIIMGSKSDWKTMIHCSDTLKKFKIKHEVNVISAHRTSKTEIIIAGAICTFSWCNCFLIEFQSKKLKV